MSGLGRGRGNASHGRTPAAIGPSRRGMPPKKSQQMLGSKGGAAATGSGRDPTSNGLDESFQLVNNGSPKFAMIFKLSPELLDELKRVEAAGGTASMKFSATPGGQVIKVGQDEFKFTYSSESGDLCNVFEEQRHGEDGQGVLEEIGAAWRKINVQRTLSASEKDRVKKRSVEAQQQSKSRTAIVLDVMKTKTDGTSDVAGRRPPLKTKKEPPKKKQKVLPAATPAKPKQQSTPSKEKSVRSPSVPVNLPPPAAAPVPIPQPPVTTSTRVSPPQPLPSVVRPFVEEIVVGGSSSPSKTAQKQQKPSSTASTPEVQARLSAALSSTDLRNSLIILLTENPKGMTLKAVEKTLSEFAPNVQAGRKNIEKVIKSIASYHAPGKYMLKPGIKPETFAKPSPGSGSLPDTAVDSPESLAESLPQGKMPAAESEWSKKPDSSMDIEHIEVAESPVKSPAKEPEVDIVMEDVTTREADVQVDDKSTPGDSHPEVPAEAAKTRADSSGSDSSSGSSDSDSDSDSSSSGTSGSSSDSGSSSSSEEEEDVDIMSDDENHSKKGRKKHKNSKQKQADEELHKDASRSSEDIDIGDADDSKAEARPEAIVETIPMIESVPMVETIPTEGDEGGSVLPSPATPAVVADKIDEDEVQAEVPMEIDPVPELAVERPSKREPWLDVDTRTERTSAAKEPRPSSERAREASERSHEQPKTYRAPASVGPRPPVETKKSDVGEEPGLKEPGRKKSVSKRAGKSDRSQKDGKRGKDARRGAVDLPVDAQSEPRGVQHRVENEGNSDLELGEFREPTPPEQNLSMSKNDDQVKPGRSKTRKIPSPVSDLRRPETKRFEEPVVSSRSNRREVSPQVKNKGFSTAPVNGERKIAPKKADRKSKDNTSADSIRSREFFAAYEKDAPELRGPIKTDEQRLEYQREYGEKYPVYLELGKYLEACRETFRGFVKEQEMAKDDKGRLVVIDEKIKAEFKRCHERYQRMTKTFEVLEDELVVIKERCKDYDGQG